MKKVFSGIFLAFFLIIISSSAYATTTQIIIDGISIVTDTNPESKNNRTMVPLRVVSENLGAKVNWSNSQVTLIKNDIHVTLKLNSKTVEINGKPELLDVKPYIKNNRTFVPMRFIAETFGSNVNYKKGIVNINTKPLVIDGVKVKALQQEYHMTMGGVVQQINGNGYNEAIYNIFVENKGSKVEAPANFSWHFHSISAGDYYKNAQYDFLDEDLNSIKRFDIYSLVQSSDETLPKQPQVLIHEVIENQWYLFSETASQAIYQLIDSASVNGFKSIISNTVV